MPSQYAPIPDVEMSETASNIDSSSAEPVSRTKEKSTYELTWAFKILSGTVWASFSLWGVWIAIYYGNAMSRRDWNALNIVFPDLYSPEYPVAAAAIGIHCFGAAFMAVAGAFQLVKYVRKEFPVFHRWTGRCYIVASIVASVGGLVFICTKGSYGGRQADIGFGAYGTVFLVCGINTYVYAIRKDFNTHKLWAWRLYSLSFASWIWRFDYYWIMALFGITTNNAVHDESYRGIFDYFENWAFFVPNLIVVEIVYRWGESARLSSVWIRLLDVCYSILWIMALIFTCHAAIQLWVPSLTGTYDAVNGWIL